MGPLKALWLPFTVFFTLCDSTRSFTEILCWVFCLILVCLLIDTVSLTVFLRLYSSFNFSRSLPFIVVPKKLAFSFLYKDSCLFPSARIYIHSTEVLFSILKFNDKLFVGVKRKAV